MRFLLLAFIVIPLIEITLLINVGSRIGAWYTVGLVLLSAFIGVNMLRYQGLSTLAKAKQRMDAGQLPAQEMVEGIILAVGGALLITPGFLTDAIGFCCLIPASRRAIARQLQSRVQVAGHGQFGFQQPPHGASSARPDPSAFGHSAPRSRPRAESGETIDGEYRRDD